MRRYRNRRQPPEPVTGKTLLRRLDIGTVHRLCHALDVTGTNQRDWKGVVAKIMDPDGYNRYSHDDLK